MSYALFDTQNGCYMHSGYGDETLEELKDSLLSYISVDFEDSEAWSDTQKLPVEKLAEYWEFEIEQGDFDKENQE